jgi:hypothetical protein
MCMIWRTNFEPLAKEHMNVMLLLKLIVSFTWNQPVSCMHCLISCISACSSTTILHPQLSKSATSYLNHDKWSPNWILQWVKVRNLMSGFSYGWKIDFPGELMGVLWNLIFNFISSICFLIFFSGNILLIFKIYASLTVPDILCLCRAFKLIVLHRIVMEWSHFYV